MNHAISGKPGDGKGLYSQRLINKDIVRTDRIVITNHAVEKDPWVTGDHRPRRGLLDFLKEKFRKYFQADERIFRLTNEAQASFFLYRGLWDSEVKKLKEVYGDDALAGFRLVTPEDGVLVDSEWRHHKKCRLYVADHVSHKLKNGKTVVDEYDTRLSLLSGGHLVITDEAWNYWPARGWAGTAQGILYYFSMVRRFGDDNWLVSQRFDDCDSILIDRCQDFHALKNLGRLRFGRFKQPPVYRVSIFQHRPTKSSEPDHKTHFTLDKEGLAQCYDTSGGVGVAGRGSADVDRKTPGLPMWLIPVAGLAVIWAVLYFGRMGLQWVHNRFSPSKKSAVESRRRDSGVQEKQNDVDKIASSAPGDAANGPDLYCTGYVILSGRPLVFLSDGSMAEPPDVSAVGTKGVVVDGKWLSLHPAPLIGYEPQAASNAVPARFQPALH